jgi:putative ABC transport system ATP-binding protein
MLNVDKVTKIFNLGTINEKLALDSVSLYLKPGDLVTVIGGNGAGKSTLLNCVAGVYRQEEGSIVLDGLCLDSCRSTSGRNTWAVCSRIP